MAGEWPAYKVRASLLPGVAPPRIGLRGTARIYGDQATLFYYLLDQSRLVPRALSLWGLITILPILFGTLLAILGYEIPFIFYVPYVPFELVIGLWILVKGISPQQENNLALQSA